MRILVAAASRAVPTVLLSCRAPFETPTEGRPPTMSPLGGSRVWKNLQRKRGRSRDPATPSGASALDARRGDRKRFSSRFPRRRLIAMAAFALLLPVIYSSTTFMLKPSSLPFGVRTVEWIRQHGGNWTVDEIEHVWYSLHAPKKGGAPLTSL